MDGQAICEVMLNAYKDLEEKCKGIDYKILKEAQRSMRADIYDTFDRVANLINEKIAYCNVKVIIDEAIEKIGDNQYIKGVYILNKTITETAEAHCIKTVEAFALYEKQKKAVYRAILDAYSTEKLFDIISDSKWLVGRYRALERFKSGSI